MPLKALLNIFIREGHCSNGIINQDFVDIVVIKQSPKKLGG